MRLKKIVLACLMSIAAAMLLAAASSADEQEQMTLIKKAVIDKMCLPEYFADEILYRRDKPLTMRVIIDGNTFYSKVEDVYSFHGDSTTLYQIGFLKPDKAIVTHNFERDMERRFKEGPVITDTLTLPPDCTPRYELTTSKKELMLQVIVRTVQSRLENWARSGIAKYPRELTLVIADFNVDYLSTYVLVEQTNKVYRTTLHNPQDYDSDEYERSGWYPFGEEYSVTKGLLKKIRKHAIRKNITLDIP